MILNRSLTDRVHARRDAQETAQDAQWRLLYEAYQEFDAYFLRGVAQSKSSPDVADWLSQLTPVWQLVSALSQSVQDGPKELNILEWMGRTSLELIGQAGLGHSLDPLVENAGKDTFVGALKNYSYVSRSLSIAS